MDDAEFDAIDLGAKAPAKVQPTLQEIIPAKSVAETPDPVDAPPETAAPVQPMTQWDALKHTMEHDTLTGWAIDKVAYPEFKPDPNLSMTMGDVKARYTDINPEYYDYITEGESVEEMDYRAEKLRERISDQDRFNALHPMEQLGLTIGATVADVPAMLMTLAASTIGGFVTGGSSTAAGGAAVATRLGITGRRIAKIVGAGVGVGVQAGIQEAILASDDPIRNEQTIALAMATGMTLGFAGGALGDTLAQKAMRKAAERDADALRTSVIKSAMEQTTTPTPTVKQVSLNSTTAGQPNMAYAGQEAVAESRLRNLGIDMTSQLKRSKDAGFRELGTILGEDAVFGGGRTMALEADVVSRPIHMAFIREYDSGYKVWAEKRGVNMIGQTFFKDRLKFNNEVAPVVRGINTSTDAGVNAAAKTTEKFFSRMLKVAKDGGLKGFEDIPENRNYLTRIYSDKQFSRAVSNFDKDTILRTIKGAIMSHQKNELDDEIAGLIAQGIYKRTMSFKGADNNMTTVLTNDIKEELTGYLKDADVHDIDIESILKQLTEKSGDGGKMNVTKNRINMDEGYVDAQSGLKFTDLLENNVEQIASVYARRVGGAAAAAKFGYQTPSALMKKIEDVYTSSVESGSLTKGQAESMRRKARIMANQILGMPVESSFINFRKGAQYLMDYEYVRTSGGFALASVPEMSIVMAENGINATLKSIPMTRKFVKDAMAGVPHDQEIFNVLDSLGVGSDIHLMRSFVRTEEDDLLGASGIPQLLQGGKRLAGTLSGLPQLTRYSQLLAGKSTINNFAKLAHKGEPVKLKQWMKQLGFNNDAQMENMLEGLRKFSTTHDGFISKKQVVGLDLDGWMQVDPTAATMFTTALTRRVNQQIQRNLTGELPEFMSYTVGKLLNQFKTFSFAAHGKKTLNALARRDVESATAMVLSSAIGTMIYAGRMSALSLTRDNPEQFRREKLAPKELAKAFVSRGGYFSLVPTLIDTVTTSVGQEPVFGGDMRTSGLNAGGVQSVPSLGTPLKLLSSTGAAVEAGVSSNEDFEENDVRGYVDALPFRRLPVVNFLLESFINQFPEKGKEK